MIFSFVKSRVFIIPIFIPEIQQQGIGKFVDDSESNNALMFSIIFEIGMSIKKEQRYAAPLKNLHVIISSFPGGCFQSFQDTENKCG